MINQLWWRSFYCPSFIVQATPSGWTPNLRPDAHRHLLHTHKLPNIKYYCTSTPDGLTPKMKRVYLVGSAPRLSIEDDVMCNRVGLSMTHWPVVWEEPLYHRRSFSIYAPARTHNVRMETHTATINSQKLFLGLRFGRHTDIIMGIFYLFMSGVFSFSPPGYLSIFHFSWLLFNSYRTHEEHYVPEHFLILLSFSFFLQLVFFFFWFGRWCAVLVFCTDVWVSCCCHFSGSSIC